MGETVLSRENYYLMTLVSGLVIMFVFVLASVVVQRRRRSRQASEQALRLGFTLMPQPDRAFNERIRCAYPPSANARAANAAFYCHNELVIYLFDAITLPHLGGRRRPAIEQGVVALVSPLLNLPPFLLVSRPTAQENMELVANMVDLALKQLGLTYGYRQVPVAGDGVFERHYLLFTNNDQAVKTFFTDSLVKLLSRSGGYILHGGGDTLLFGNFNLARHKKPASTDQVASRISQARQLYGWILENR